MQYLNAPFRQAKFKGSLLKRCLIYSKKTRPLLLNQRNASFSITYVDRALETGGAKGECDPLFPK